MLGIVAFASASAYLTRYCISAANTTMQQDLGFDDKQMGQLMSGFALGYLLFQVPGGWLGNRFGTRFAFAFLSVCWSLCNVWTAGASLLRILWASRFSLGVFQAGLAPISAKILKDWIPVRQRGISSACVGASMSIGGGFTLWLTGWLLTAGISWRVAFAAYSVVGIVWAVGFFWFFRTCPEEHKDVNAAELTLIRDSDHPLDDDSTPGESRHPVDDVHSERDHPGGTEQAESADALPTSLALVLNMLRCPSMWGLCVQSFFRAAGYAFFVTWFFAYLEYVFHITKAEAGFLNSLPLYAVVIGSILGGFIVDWLLRISGSKWISRSGTAIVALTVCGVFTMASAWTSSATGLAILIAVGALFSGIGSPAAWAATIDLGGRHTAVVMGVMNMADICEAGASPEGVMNMAGCLAGVILPIVLGNWFDQIRETGGDWNLVIYLHAAFYFMGALSWIAIDPNRGVAD